MNNLFPSGRRGQRWFPLAPRSFSLFLLMLILFFAGATVLVACGGGSGNAGDYASDESFSDGADFEDVQAMPTVAPEVPAEPVADGGVVVNEEGQVVSTNTNPTQQGQQRLIIKDGQMTVEVMETDAAAEELINVTVDFGGYVIGQRIWTGEGGYRFANIQVAVPVDQFEAAMRAFRTLGTVLDESASGEDVTDEYVDLNSRLGNLYATQERLRTFLEQATTISETLKVHEELTTIEEEISIVQGRINFLQDRAAFSTITVNLQPFIPTPIPSATPTATMIPTAESWRPGDTAQTALVQLQESGQSFFDFILYNGIVCGPWILGMVLLAYLAIRGYYRWLGRSAPPVTRSVPPPSKEE